MTRGSVKEYLEAIKGRCVRAERKENGKIVDEAVQVTGHHSKALIRALRSGPDPGRGKKAGWPKQYGHQAVSLLKTVWEASDRVCGKRVQPFLAELMEVLERHGELTPGGELRKQVERMSAATITGCSSPTINQDCGVPSAPPSQAACLRRPSPSAPSLNEMINGQGFWR